MKAKRLLIILMLSLLSLVSACTLTTVETTDTTATDTTTTSTTTSETTTTTTEEPADGIGAVSGLANKTIITNHYFHPLKGVEILSEAGKDITSLLTLSGSVDYGTPGDYVMTYSLVYGEETFSQNRTITVQAGSFVAPSGSRPNLSLRTLYLGDGSYRVGPTDSLVHPASPSFIEADLFVKAVPSNGWWTTLLTANYGNSNGIYTNPLKSSFSNDGVEITNPGEGFVQYWNVENTQRMAQYSISLKDMHLKTTDLNAGFVTKVIDYGDSSVKVAMRNVSSSEDKMVITYAQGSPYLFAEVANKATPYLKLDTTGVDNYEYFNLDGTKITTATYTGDAIIVKMVRRHIGYTCTPPANVGQPIYADRYFLVNTPNGTTFTIGSANHPFGLFNRLGISLGEGNYLSIAAIPSLTAAAFYHQHGYAFIADTNNDYVVDHTLSQVQTTYKVTPQMVRSTEESAPVLALMPHQYKYSDAVTTSQTFRTVRGTLKVMIGSSFDTVLPFYGILPGYTLPEDGTFSSETVAGYLANLNTQTDIADTENFLNADAPYWNSKALYPLAQGAIIADQIGETALRDGFVAKLKYLLEDWYTYTNPDDTKYLYYNQTWGSVYYSDNEFNTAGELSDHSFTHGYLIYASAVVAMYDTEFATQYGGMVDLLLDDYMYPIKDDSSFAYLRSFDSWAGHSWAHGYGSFAEGNNLESTSEALNSWVGGYLWGQAMGDTDRVDAAIYGFVTELSAIKEYWFDYDQENWSDAYANYAAVAGMVWGGKFDYATWFGANPTFIYGIQWLPSGEFLTNYAMNATERARLTTIYETYLDAKGGTVDTWFSNMWAVQSIIDPAAALTLFNATQILNDDYPSELAGSYWMIHAMNTLNTRTTSVWMEVHEHVSSTCYELANGTIIAMVWNGSANEETVHFRDDTGVVSTFVIPAKSFTKVTIE